MQIQPFFNRKTVGITEKDEISKKTSKSFQQSYSRRQKSLLDLIMQIV